MGPEVLCHVIIYILSPLLHSIDHKHITVTEYSRGGYYTDMNVRKQGSLPSLYPFYFFFLKFPNKITKRKKVKGRLFWLPVLSPNDHNDWGAQCFLQVFKMDRLGQAVGPSSASLPDPLAGIGSEAAKTWVGAHMGYQWSIQKLNLLTHSGGPKIPNLYYHFKYR